jgi:hypothetical protein
MKVLLVMLLLPIIGHAQRSFYFPWIDTTIIYTEIVNADSLTVSQLHSNAVSFVNKSAILFNNSIQLVQNKLSNYILQNDTDKIIAIIKMPIEQTFGRSDFAAIVTIDIKPGRYRYNITDIRMTYSSAGVLVRGANGQVNTPLEMMDTDKSRFLKKVSMALEGEVSLLKKTMVSKPDNW